MDISERLMPFAFVAFFVWDGATFAFNAHTAASGQAGNLFGTNVDSVVNAGLDYGYWIGACGALLLVASVGLLNKQIQKFAVLVVIVIVAVGSVAFGFTRLGKEVHEGAAQAHVQASPQVSAASADATSPAATEGLDFDASSYVQVVSVTGNWVQKDYEASRYSNAVRIYPRLKNVSNKTIVGLRGRISMIDGFGKEVYGFGFRDDDKLLAEQESRSGGGYNFEENQFEDDDPYHKMLPLINAGTAKYTVHVTQIAFNDGTVLPKK